MKIHMQVMIAVGLGLKRNWHIFFGIIAGVFAGIILHGHQNSMIFNALTFVGQAFIRLIQMVVIPLVVSSVIIGIASIGDNKQLGKFGIKMVVYYAIITVIAVLIGLTLCLAIQPGQGAQQYIDAQAAGEIQQQVAATIENQRENILNIILEFLPKNPFSALAMGDMVQILIFTLMFAIALSRIGEISRPVISFFESIFAATMKVTDWIMYFAAPGVFALTATSIASFGLDIFSSISKYLLVIAVGLAIQFFIVYPLFLRIFSKVPVFMLYAAMTEAMMVAFGTASSSATLPLTIACCEKRGISHKIASFVLPLGATLNMDGTAMTQIIAVMFLAQAYGVDLSLFMILQIFILTIVASSTCAGIPGTGLITVVLVLNGMGLTPEQLISGFALLYTMDRITDMLCTMLNVTSDAVVAATIADNENEINYDLLNNPDNYNEVI